MSSYFTNFTTHCPLCILHLRLQPSVMLPEACLWKSLFEEPELWFDKRPTKNNRPAFVHRHHHYPLWLGDRTPAEAIEHVQRIDDLNEGRWVKVSEQTALQHAACLFVLLQRYTDLGNLSNM